MSALGQAPPPEPVPDVDVKLERSFLRVPVRIDDAVVLSDLLLEVETASMDASLAVFEASALTPSGQAFAALIQGLAAGRADEVGVFHRRAPFSQIVGEDLATAYVNGFGDSWGGAQVRRRYLLGNEELFVWDMQIEGRTIPRGFRIRAAGRGPGGADPFWLENQSTKGMQALKTVITEAERLVREGNEGFVDEAAALARGFRREVPGTPAAWRFNGTSVDWDAFAEGAAVPQHPAAAFYSAACVGLKSGDAEVYATHFSPASAQRFREWVNGMEPGGYTGFVNDSIARGRRVVFFLDAAPATLVFFMTSDGQLTYETLHQDPASGEFKIVSFYMYGLFDNLLNDVDFFQRPVILPIAGGGAELLLGGEAVEVPDDPAEPDASVGNETTPTVPNNQEIAAPSSESSGADTSPFGRSLFVALLIGLLLVGLLALVIYFFQKQK